MIIGLSGYAGSGKDTAAQGLIERGYTRIAFADVLKKMAYALDPYVLASEKTEWVTDLRPEQRPIIRLQTLVSEYGWDFVKNTYPDVRRLLQRLGTEAGREILGDNIWVDTALKDAPEKAVVTDVRFPNEVQAILDRGGVVIRIVRPSVNPRNGHPSETALDDYKFIHQIRNVGTPTQLEAKLVKLVEQIEVERQRGAL